MSSSRRSRQPMRSRRSGRCRGSPPAADSLHSEHRPAVIPLSNTQADLTVIGVHVDDGPNRRLTDDHAMNGGDCRSVERRAVSPICYRPTSARQPAYRTKRGGAEPPLFWQRCVKPSPPLQVMPLQRHHGPPPYWALTAYQGRPSAVVAADRTLRSRDVPGRVEVVFRIVPRVV